MASSPPPGALMTIGGGVQMSRSQYLTGFKEECIAAYPTVPILPEKYEATIDGTIDDVFAEHPELKPVLFNEVLICAKCSKPCGFTLKVCNGCGSSLEGVGLGKSENVFTAFLFGVRKAGKGFPYLLSLRRETTAVVVMDDLLALSNCHFNCIPKTYYIPDWRFLLKAPKHSLDLLDVMEAECAAAMEPFLKHPEWKKHLLRGDVSDEEIRTKVIRFFNFPPSQNLLHIQWVVPPLHPFRHYMAQTKNHFNEGRCFPMSYVRQILALNEPYEVEMSTPIEEIVAHFDERVNYKQHWTEMYERALQDTMDLQNWDAQSFRYVAEGCKAHEFAVQDGKVVIGAALDDVDLKDVHVKDTAALRNYGRPYGDGGKAAGTYVQNPIKAYAGWPPADTESGP